MTFVFNFLRERDGNRSRLRRRHRFLLPANLSWPRRSRHFCWWFDNSNCRQFQPRHSDQIISACYEVAPRLRSFPSPVAGPPHSAHRLHPAEDFLNPLPYPQTGLVTGTARGALIQSQHLHPFLARSMGRDFPLPTPLHKKFLVISLVRTDGLGVRAWVQLGVLIQLSQRHDRLGFGDGIMQGEIGAQAVTVFHERVCPKIQPGFLALGFPIQHALRISRALVRVVATLFTPEVHAGVARIIVLGRLNFLLIPAILADEAFQAGPRLDQRAVGGEVFITGPAFLAREVIHFDKEQLGNFGGEDALVVLGEDAVVEAALAELAVQKPEPEQIIAELFAEEPFAAHTIQGGEYPGLEQLLRRNAGTTFVGIELLEQRRELLQDRIHAALNNAQRMPGGHAGVEIDNSQKVRLGLRFSAHGSLTHPHPSCSNILRVFQQPAITLWWSPTTTAQSPARWWKWPLR